jgi:short-subunit dehydrogenase
MMGKPLAVVTGASSGLGEVFARKLAAEYDLLLVARRKERLEALAAELTAQYGCEVAVLPADLTDEKDLAAVADRIAAEPTLALLVNNAGFGARGLFWESDLEVQEQMHRLHVMATVRLSHAALRNLVAKNAGGVINVASVAAFLQRAGSVSYGATKRWMVTFTEALYLYGIPPDAGYGAVKHSAALVLDETGVGGGRVVEGISQRETGGCAGMEVQGSRGPGFESARSAPPCL